MFFQRRVSPGVVPKAPFKTPQKLQATSPEKAPPKTPTSVFGEKKHWEKLQLRERVRKLSPFILRGKMFTKQEREKMVEQWFPYKKYGTHITEGKAKHVLRELRKAENRARTNKEKDTYKWQKRLLEAFTGIKRY